MQARLSLASAGGQDGYGSTRAALENLESTKGAMERHAARMRAGRWQKQA